ncbi:MAG: TolC family protein [Legionellaceae bacterium]|nr:TolC family protein [Legionellaceae bacterium]
MAKARGDYITALGQFDPNLKIKTRSLPEGGYVSNYANNEISLPTLTNGIRLFGGYRNGGGSYPIYYQNYLTNSGGEYRAGFALPLLKDRAIDKQRADLWTRTATIAITQNEVTSTKLTVYQEAIKAYWSWVQTGLQLKTFIKLLKLAERRQAAIEQQAQQGDLPRIAVSENQQIIMQRRQWVNQGNMMLEQASVALAMYYRTPKGKPLRPRLDELPSRVQPSKLILTKDKREVHLELLKHPSLCKLERYYGVVKLQQTLARNELLPNLDATAFTSKQYGTGGYERLLPQATQIGLNFKFPIYQRQARGKILSTTSELKQVLTQKKFVYEQLTNRLSGLWIALNRYQKQINLIQHELTLATRVANAERRKFHAGDSSLFLVNQREQTSTEVRLNLISSEINLQQTQSLIQFFASTTI